jgi:ATP-binding cassette subfamily B protein
VTLSGGQKQRISMARAFLLQPELLLLDDCLSAVDSHTEQEISSFINHSFHGKTVLLATHRIPAHFLIDKVIVLENGQIAEYGQPEYLLSRNSIFKKMLDKQRVEESPRLN